MQVWVCWTLRCLSDIQVDTPVRREGQASDGMFRDPNTESYKAVRLSMSKCKK